MPANKNKTSSRGVVGRMGSLALRLLVTANAIAVAILWLSASMQWLSPGVWAFGGLLCMAFPVFLIINILFIPVWVVVRVRYVLLPIVGLLCCIGSIRSYCPMVIGGPQAGESTFKVIAFNTFSWGRDHGMDGNDNLVVRWCVNQEPDVMLLQEVHLRSGRVQPLLDAGYEIIVAPDHPRRTMAIVTRLPVLDSDSISTPTEGNNGAIYAHLLCGHDTLTVVCAHLESFKLLPDERDEYVAVVKHPTSDGTKTRTRTLVERILPVLSYHGGQADSILAFVRSEQARGRHVIVGGDLNDVPNSYAAARLRSELTDCYRTTGRGLGFTFSEQYMYFRIDHLFCSPSLNPIRTRIDKSIIYSDHYPLVSEFAF